MKSIVFVALFAFSDGATLQLHNQSVNATGTMTMAEARKVLTNVCLESCSGDAACAESSCVTECESEAYRCLDVNDPPHLEDRVPICEAKVSSNYHNTNPECCCSMLLSKKKTCKVCNKKGGKNSGEVVSMSEARKRITEACLSQCTPAACGMASSECVTPCETESYRCLDTNKHHLLEENVQACETEVVPKFSSHNPDCCCMLALKNGGQKNCKKCDSKKK